MKFTQTLLLLQGNGNCTPKKPVEAKLLTKLNAFYVCGRRSAFCRRLRYIFAFFSSFRVERISFVRSPCRVSYRSCVCGAPYQLKQACVCLSATRTKWRLDVTHANGNFRLLLGYNTRNLHKNCGALCVCYVVVLSTSVFYL